jgi:hypothetical protein
MPPVAAPPPSDELPPANLPPVDAPPIVAPPLAVPPTLLLPPLESGGMLLSVPLQPIVTQAVNRIDRPNLLRCLEDIIPIPVMLDILTPRWLRAGTDISRLGSSSNLLQRRTAHCLLGTQLGSSMPATPQLHQSAKRLTKCNESLTTSTQPHTFVFFVKRNMNRNSIMFVPLLFAYWQPELELALIAKWPQPYRCSIAQGGSRAAIAVDTSRIIVRNSMWSSIYFDVGPSRNRHHAL